MNEIKLIPMTRSLCHEFFEHYENDPNLYMDMNELKPYIYSKEKADAYFDKEQRLGRISLAIMKDDHPIGEILFKEIDTNRSECTIGICLQNDTVKGKGYGTVAERLAVQYAFEALDMSTIKADVVVKNKRSQHVLEKIGFQRVGADDSFVYYEIQK